MANITTAQVATAIGTIIASESLGYLKSMTVMPQLVNRKYEPMPRKRGDTISVPKRGTLTVQDKLANTPMVPQSTNSSKVDIVLSNHKYCTIRVEDIAEFEASFNIRDSYLGDQLAVVCEAVDASLLGLYASAGNTLNYTGGLIVDSWKEARRLLNENKASMTQRYGVWHEDAEREALGLSEIIDRDYRGDVAADALREGHIGRFVGIDNYMDQNVVSVAGSPNTLKNFIFQKNALTLVTANLPLPANGAGLFSRFVVQDGVGMRVMVSYDHLHTAYIASVEALWGVGVLRPEHLILVETAEA